MASLYEYFIKDGSNTTTMHQTLSLSDRFGNVLLETIGRVHFDFDAGGVYISFYIPFSDKVRCPEAILLNKVNDLLKWSETDVYIHSGFANLDMQDSRDLIFTGRVYLYSEQPVSAQLKEQMNSESKLEGYSLIFRSVEYVEQRNKFEKPQAFISHDSRDKLEIAEPLAVHLTKLMCPLWYDEFSLKVGDSLRDSIENGLKECHKCVFIITQNFLSNGGWSKREYDSVFTREIMEKRNVIIPIWYNVTPQDVYSYSPILADRVAVDWSLGIEKVANKILLAINA